MKTPRKRDEFSEKVRDQASQRADGHCEKCGIAFGRKKPEFDHILPAEYGGKGTLSNCQVLCAECHKAKTKTDVRGMRKADRQRRSNNGAKVRGGSIPSRPTEKKPKIDKLPIPPPRAMYRSTDDNH
ncbi:MAG: HNH endonuclease [Beijerinckiaceae bacterium]|nr:HNH endonuclease [Beijerinckiaceae bacterium]